VPEGFRAHLVRPEGALFNETLGEFLLPYGVVQTSKDPDAALLAFFQSTYEAAADSAHWDRTSLEREPGLPGICPSLGSLPDPAAQTR
jgi:hypothetical protein